MLNLNRPLFFIVILFGLTSSINCTNVPEYDKETIEETLEHPNAETYSSEVSDIPGRNALQQDATRVENHPDTLETVATDSTIIE